MAKGSKKITMAGLRKQVEKLTKRNAELEGPAAVLNKLKRVGAKDTTHAIGFFAMSYIIKEGVFDPFSKIFDLELFEFDVEASVLADTGLFPLGLVPRLEVLTEKIRRLPETVGRKLGKDLSRDLGIIKDKEGKTDATVDEEVRKAVEQRLREVTLGITELTIGSEAAEKLRDSLKRQAADNLKKNLEKTVWDYEWKVEFAGWMFGFAGAWAVGKFLSETTITELAEAVGAFVPFT